MPKLMRPITFGCENGFQEVYYEIDNPVDDSKQESGKIFCYLSRLNDEDKANAENLKKCLSMKPGQCWKNQ